MKQLVIEKSVPIPMEEGKPVRFDYEYERNGTANMLMVFAPLEGWRHVKATDRHTAVDYAHVLKDLSDIHFPKARKIVLVQDTLNTHVKASLYQSFPSRRASSNASSGTIPRSTAIGSTWPSPNWASSPRNVSTAVFPISRCSSTKSSLGKRTKTAITPRPTGSSQPRTPVSSSNTSTRNLTDTGQ